MGVSASVIYQPYISHLSLTHQSGNLKVLVTDIPTDRGWCLGKPNVNKTDEFSAKFQMAFDPPPSFSENHIADFLGHVDVCAFWYNFAIKYIRSIKGKLQYNFLDRKWNLCENSSILVFVRLHLVGARDASASNKFW